MSVEVAPAPSPNERSGDIARIEELRNFLPQQRRRGADHFRRCQLAAAAVLGTAGIGLVVAAGVLATFPDSPFSLMVVSLADGMMR